MHVIPSDVILAKVAEKRRAKARREFDMAMAHGELDGYRPGSHSRAHVAQGFALLRAARRAERGEL